MKIPWLALICCFSFSYGLLETNEDKKLVNSNASFNKNEHLISKMNRSPRDSENGTNEDHDDHGHDEHEENEVNQKQHDDHDHDNDHDHDHDHDHDLDNTKKTWTTAQKWGYATLANTFLVSLAVLGIFLIKCSTPNSRLLVGDVFLGLAVSTMLGDSLLHILPSVLGLHEHGTGEEGHDDHDHEAHGDEGNDEHAEYLLVVGKMGVLVAAIYAFWVFESFMTILGGGHSHSHGGPQVNSHENKPKASASEDDDGFGISVGTEPKWSTIAGVFTGDCLHNFIDGIAVGISWSVSWGAGLGTTFAIMMHELPHELGDFVLYKKLGLSTKKAIGANLIAAVISFAGLFTGLALGEDPTVTSWLLAIVAGLFIYISMVDVMPEMKLTKDTDRKMLRFGLQNVGMLLGFTIMVLLSIFEEDFIIKS